MEILRNILILIGFYMVLTGCHSDPMPKTCPPYCDPVDTTDTVKPTLPYDLIRQESLFPQDSRYSITSFHTTFYKNKIFASKRKGWSYNEIINAFDTSGNNLWEWQEYIKQPNDLLQRIIYDKENIIINTGKEIHVVDFNKGQTIFQNKVSNDIPTSLISMTSDNIYKTFDRKIFANPISELKVLDKENSV